MRAVTKNFNRPPSHLTPNNLEQVIDTTNPDHKRLIQQTIYGDASIVNKLKLIYTNKCAYCECYEPEPEVEHYRPKKGVTGVAHSGYYWLCYEWSNLMPACHDCNKTRSKGNHFPVHGNVRVNAPVVVAGRIDLSQNRLDSNALSVIEIPLLLNPEFPNFNPFIYFKIDSNGKFVPCSDPLTLEFKKAEATINTIRLNRDKLFLGTRKREIRYYMKRLGGVLYKYLLGHTSLIQYENEFLTLLTEIDNSCRLTAISENWFFWNYFRDNFKIFITAYFKTKLAVGLCRTYDVIR